MNLEQPKEEEVQQPRLPYTIQIKKRALRQPKSETLFNTPPPHFQTPTTSALVNITVPPPNLQEKPPTIIPPKITQVSGLFEDIYHRQHQYLEQIREIETSLLTDLALTTSIRTKHIIGIKLGFIRSVKINSQTQLQTIISFSETNRAIIYIETAHKNLSQQQTSKCPPNNNFDNIN